MSDQRRQNKNVIVSGLTTLCWMQNGSAQQPVAGCAPGSISLIQFPDGATSNAQSGMDSIGLTLVAGGHKDQDSGG